MLGLRPLLCPPFVRRFACLPDKETVERIGFVKVEIKGDFAVFHCGVGEHLAGDGKADGIEQGLVAGVVFAEPPLQGRGAEFEAAVLAGLRPWTIIRCPSCAFQVARPDSGYLTPRELTRAEIRQIIADYAQAAKNAIKAGFDGVEFHAANGYLPQQFLADSSNQRNDEYGGSIENKARFTLEAMQAIIAAIGGDKVGIKISPLHPYAGIAFNDPVATYHYLIGALNKLDFSFVEIMKRSPAFPLLPHYPQDDEIERFGKMVEKTLIAGTGYNAESGEKELEKALPI